MPRKSNLVEFQGTPPYAAEMFGVYQPLLGWRSKRKQRRLDTQIVHNTGLVIGMMSGDPALLEFVKAGGALGGLNTTPPPKDPGWTDPHPDAAELKKAIAAHVVKTGEVPKDDEWQAIVATLGGGDGHAARRGVRNARAFARFLAGNGDGGDIGTRRMVGARARGYIRRLAGNANPGQALATPVIESTLQQLAAEKPEILKASVAAQPASWVYAKYFVNPLELFGEETREAFLSPVGLINVFRQYFFDLEGFLGPSVDHVWVSPGGTVELYEVQTQRVRIERAVETALDLTTRTELTVTQEDELSSVIARQNQTNTSFGISASGGFQFAVAQGNASANFNLDRTTAEAKTTTHRHARDQSQTVSQELRRSYKTTFRETREVEDVSSRRHVLSNPANEIANYELRRKMRRIGVQLQHIETQLCWQVFVDSPGADVAMAQLVHIAKPEDAASPPPPPEAPPELPPKSTDITVMFPYEPLDGNWPDARYVKGGVTGMRIRWKREFTAVPPDAGYKLKAVTQTDVSGTNPDKWHPEVAADYELVGGTTDRFKINLTNVVFYGNPALRFSLTLVWAPPDQTAAHQQYLTKQKDWKDEERRLAHEQYVKAVQERIEQASAVRARPAEDLREEERTLVFRRLISQLTQLPRPESTHTVSELIRASFDVDRMLYFVAPEWWRPRARGTESVRGNWGTPLDKPEETPVETLAADNLIGWGGVSNAARMGYPITERSEPAPMGASLGWLLQLDGDRHRNAFLNTPWVKAVIPIRAGKEKVAIEWLEQSGVEGADGLDEPYSPGRAAADEADGGGAGGEGAVEPGDEERPTLRQVLLQLAAEINAENTDVENALATETVYEEGFDPLEEGFKASGERFEIFDQWTENMATKEIAAVPYDTKKAAKPKGERGLFARLLDW
jgi:hypothetical protein